MDAATQCGKILAYCDEHGSITAREAFIRLGINSPRKAISVLKQKGYEVKVVKMDNNGKTPYNRYYISKKEGDSVEVHDRGIQSRICNDIKKDCTR